MIQFVSKLNFSFNIHFKYFKCLTEKDKYNKNKTLQNF